MYNMQNIELEYFFSQLPEETQKLSKLLMLVNWDNVDFDIPYFKYSNKIDHKSLSEDQMELIKLILENIPEWERLVNCKQHPTHDYDLGIHTLLVIKKMHQLSQYHTLSRYNKLMLMYTALLHDIEKVEKEVDPEHPAKGAKTASDVLYRLGFEEEFINDIYLLIKNHQLLGLIASGKIRLNPAELAYMFKKEQLIELLGVLAIADIKSVKKKEAFFSEKIGQNIEHIKTITKDYIKDFLN